MCPAQDGHFQILTYNKTMEMISQEEALRLIKPQCKMHDVVSGTIDTSGGSDSQTFSQNNYDILIYRSVFSMFFENASSTKSEAIIQSDATRDKFTGTIMLSKTKTAYNPIDVFDWNNMNTENLNGFYWLVRSFDQIKVTLNHILIGTLYANPAPITWSFAMQYYELRDGE